MRQKLIKRIPSLHHEHPSYKWWVLVNIMISTFMAVLTATITNTALPKIMTSLSSSTDVAQWILTGYMLAFAIMLPSSGWMADRFGYKRTYLFGIVIFTLFSFLCGISWNEMSLICMRIGQGIGGGILQPLGMAIIMREFPPRSRGLAMGFWSISSAASVSLGPMLGGYLVDNYNWHIIFNINVPVGIICLLATWIIQREYRTDQKLNFDLPGFTAMSVFLGFLLVALSSGNAQWNSGGWTSDFMMLCYALSFLGFVFFIVIELNTRNPLVDLRLLRRFNFGLNNLVMFLFGVGMFGSTFLMPLYLQNVLGYTAFQSGLVFLPVGILQALFGPISGFLYNKINPKIFVMLGIILFAESFFLNTQLSIYSEHAQIVLPMYLRGIAMGILFSPLSAMALLDIKRHELAQASGLMNVIRQVGGSFGVAILQALLTQRMAFHSAISSTSINKSSPLFIHTLQMLNIHAIHEAGSSLQAATSQSSAILFSNFSQQIFVRGIDDDFMFACIATAVCIVPVLFLKTPKKERKSQASRPAE